MKIFTKFVSGLSMASVALCSLSTSVFAETIPNPDSVRSSFEKPNLNAPGISDGPGFENLTPVAEQIDQGGPQIHVNSFALVGNEIYSTEQLMGLIEQYEGQDLTLQQIYAVADILTNFYRSEGYTLVQVTIPAQKVSSGNIRFEVIEGRVGATQFEGNEAYSDEFIGSRLKNVVPGAILTTADLERELMILNDLPGLSSRAVIKPGSRFGTSDVIIRSEETPYSGSLTLNNYGNASTGEWRLQGDITWNNPLTMGDSLNLFFVKSEDGLLKNGRVEWSLPVNEYGTRVSASWNRFVYKVDTEKLDPAGFPAGGYLDGGGSHFRIQLSHPLIRSPSRNLLIAAGIERDITTQGDEFTKTGVPLVADVDGRKTYNLFDISAVLSQKHADGSVSDLSAILSTNFKNNNPNGTVENAQKAKVVVNATHTRGLYEDWYLVAKGSAQYASQTLIGAQKFRIGGPGNVRAFGSAELSGDEGVLLSFEARRPVHLFDAVPTVFKAFWDGAKVFRKTPDNGQDVSLTGIGVGLTGIIEKAYTFDLELSIPMNSHYEAYVRGSPQIWASVARSF